MIDENAIRSRYEAMRPGLDERERRLLAAAEARTAGYGGVSAVARATGIARSTIDRGLKDLEAPDPVPPKVRRPGGGRPSLAQTDPTLLEDLHRLLEPLATNRISMTRIESRPSRRGKWNYVFFIDIEGHASDVRVARALKGLKARASLFRVIGSYPRSVL